MSIVYVRKIDEGKIMKIDLSNFDSIQNPEVRHLVEFFINSKYSQPSRVIGLKHVASKTLEEANEPVPLLFGGLDRINSTRYRPRRK